MELHHRSGLGRPVDPRFPTNLAVLILVPVVGVIAAGVFWALGTPPVDALFRAATVAVAGFGGWALMRELAPDDPRIAFAALAAGAVVAAVVPGAGLLPLFGALLFSRIVNRTVGPDLFPGDYVMVAALSAWCAWSGAAEVLAAGALAFVLDARLGGRRWHTGVGVLLALAALLRAPEWAPIGDPVLLAVFALGSLAVVVSIVRCPSPACSNDAGTARLDRDRVRGGIVVVATVAVLGSGAGPEGVVHAAIVWATLGLLPFATGPSDSAFRAPEVDA